MKNLVYSSFGPPWFAGWKSSSTARPFFGLLRGSGGPRIRTERLASAFGNHFFSPNIIYSSSAGLVPLGSLEHLRSAGFRGPVIHNQNGLYFPAWFKGECAKKNAELANFSALSDYVIFQSDFCRRAFLELIPQGKLPSHEVLLNPSPDLSGGNIPVWNGPPQLLVAGNLGQGGAHVLLPALRMFARAGKRLGASLLVLGNPPSDLMENTEIRQALGELEAAGINERLRFAPYDLASFRSLLHGRPISLHLRYKDACPNAVPEKLSLGIPHIFSHSGGTPELVGKAGMGIPVEESWDRLISVSAVALENAVDSVLARYEELSNQARLEFTTRLTFESYVRRHEEIFRRALEKSL